MDKVGLPAYYPRLNSRQRMLVREEYVKIQNGICQQCASPLSDNSKVPKLSINRALFPVGFFTHPIHLHHNHKTGMTIGAVHAECNAIAWQYFGE